MLETIGLTQNKIKVVIFIVLMYAAMC